MSYNDTIQKLQPGGYYHVYNRGNNKEILFKEPANYYYFLKLWKKYIHPVAETYCYILLPNHFHFFIRVRQQTSQVSETCESLISRAFSNLFNAYAKAINKKYNRTGSLFQERFRRKEITSDAYFTQIIGYILTNAVKHGFVKDVDDYPYSAWHSLLSSKPTELLRDEVISWFGNKRFFVQHIKNYQLELAALKNLQERKEDDE